jgi:hypothetical protein
MSIPHPRPFCYKFRLLGDISNPMHISATIAFMPLSVARSPLELIGNTAANDG